MALAPESLLARAIQKHALEVHGSGDALEGGDRLIQYEPIAKESHCGHVPISENSCTERAFRLNNGVKLNENSGLVCQANLNPQLLVNLAMHLVCPFFSLH